MPVLLRYQSFRFFFYSSEGDPREPPHIHVRKDGAEAKFWLTPAVRCAWTRRFDERTLKMLETMVIEHKVEFEEQWHVFVA
ncbi:DUF4160 domain-containing protein [Sphingorhabdus sp. IMCC26285]|uniref:DUF4160 domain-containing protein n=1 Tax=Sphingorhabdus profundilacus TaxID=2509718 RepID=A0A6I4LSL7_9SPHN|nr:DUF4160 domain-containing protein [Sphingorhabdus profundilacus]MVZ96412.1 DUF4160 domain-containing protein [Sphingorhabdus profundilacus]